MTSKIVITRTTKELMTPAAPSIVKTVQQQYLGGVMIVLGVLAVFLSFFYWTAGPVSEYVVPFAAAGCALAVSGVILYLLSERAYKHLVQVVDTQTVEEREKPLEGKLVSTLVEDPKDPSRLVGPSGVRLRVDQWNMIYEASESSGWKFSRPMIEQAIKSTGIKIPGLNKKYTSLHKWMLAMDMIIDTRPDRKNPEYRLTPKGKSIVEGYTEGVEYAGRNSDVR
jgi:hypothetical protein